MDVAKGAERGQPSVLCPLMDLLGILSHSRFLRGGGMGSTLPCYSVKAAERPKQVPLISTSQVEGQGDPALSKGFAI